MKDEENDSFYAWAFIVVVLVLVAAVIARENMDANPVPGKFSSTAPSISLVCKGNLFYIVNGVDEKRVPLTDIDVTGNLVQVPCTKAFEVIQRRRIMGLQ